MDFSCGIAGSGAKCGDEGGDGSESMVLAARAIPAVRSGTRPAVMSTAAGVEQHDVAARAALSREDSGEDGGVGLGIAAGEGFE